MSGLNQAIAKNELRMYLQPKVLLRDRTVASAEALIRGQHPVRGMVSSAGISAALPPSIALVDAIAGRARAAALAKERGVAEWGPIHNSDVFLPQFGVNLTAFATTHFTNPWFHSMHRIGLPVAQGINDIALAFTADAYSRTGRSQAYALAVSSQPVRTRNRLMIVPDLVVGSGPNLTRILPELDSAMPA